MFEAASLSIAFEQGIGSPRDVWEPPEVSDPRGSGIYVAIIGNTGAGKSTLVRGLARAIGEQGDRVVGIDERSTHHPFLDRLFHDPRRYGLELQLNFMLQRGLLVRRWQDAGFGAVMERSHLDDLVFARYLHDREVISTHEFETYMGVWGALASRFPVPDLLIAFDLPAEECIRRVTQAEDKGDRPREFQDEQQKRDWVVGWAELYSERLAELAAASHGPPMVEVRNPLPLEELVSTALDRLGRSRKGEVWKAQG